MATVQPVAVPVMAMATAAFPRRVRAMGFRRVFAAASFAARFSPGTDLFAVVPFVAYRLRPFAAADFVPAADPFDPVVVAGPGLVGPAAAAVVVVAADLSVVAAGPGFVGSVVFAVDLASSVCPFAAALGKGRIVAVPFCFLTHRSSF